MSGVISELDCYHPKFPHVSNALLNPNGLLAFGGNLDPTTLLDAYSRGIFPWSAENEPILWWCPDPRCVLYCDQLHIGRTLKRALYKNTYRISADTAFEQVINHCATRVQTWINPMLHKSFCSLHEQGYAHSIEVWADDNLIGGLYGLLINGYFAGESMFSHQPNASKIAIIYLVQYLSGVDINLIDCQMTSKHLIAFGATEIKRNKFLSSIKQGSSPIGKWSLTAQP